MKQVFCIAFAALVFCLCGCSSPAPDPEQQRSQQNEREDEDRELIEEPSDLSFHIDDLLILEVDEVLRIKALAVNAVDRRGQQEDHHDQVIGQDGF